MEKESSVELYGNDRYFGYCVDLAEKIAQICQIDYKIELVEDKMYGAPLDNGTWNGMVGELMEQVRLRVSTGGVTWCIRFYYVVQPLRSGMTGQ